MLEVPVDAWYVWIGLATIAAAVLGVAAALPTAPPPDAGTAADAVDAVAAAENGSTGEHSVTATAVKLTPHGVSLRSDGGISHARFAYGPVTPVTADGRLREVLDGTPPGRVFDSPEELAEGATIAQKSPYRWQPADQIRVKTIVWRDVRVTLVSV